MRAHHRDRTVLPAGRTGDERRTVRQRPAVFWVVDNGSSHRGQPSIKRMRSAWPNAQLIHLPVHASWLDQTEIYFSVVQRKVLNPNDFTDRDQIRDRLTAFETRYNAVAKPFDWKYTRTDLNDLPHRIDAHQPPIKDHQLAASRPPTNLRARPLSRR
jgi:DDE superfamily endonuclease